MAKLRQRYESFKTGDLVMPVDLYALPEVKRLAEGEGVVSFCSIMMVCATPKEVPGEVPEVRVMHLSNGASDEAVHYFPVKADKLTYSAPETYEKGSPLRAWLEQKREHMLALLQDQ